jgi:PAS domain S-box-containing protein
MLRSSSSPSTQAGSPLPPSLSTEEALRLTEANYRLLFERNPAPMLIYERGTMRIVAVNDAFVDHYGYGREEILDMLLPDLYPEEEKAPIEARARELHGAAHVGEWRHLKRDGSLITVSVRSHDIAFDDRTCRIAVITDVAETKRVEAERQLLLAQLVQSQKLEAIGQLAGGVAHDFNNILTAMLMQLGMLSEDTAIYSLSRRLVEELEGEAHRAAELTRQLLMFSRRQVLQTRRLELNSLLGNLLKMLRRLIGEQISLEFQGVGGDLWLEVDPGMLEQVVMNLVVNARDAMGQGGRIRLSTRMERLEAVPPEHALELPAGDYICIEVADEGCGMDEATRKRIFEPFFTTKEAGKGTGLGLATAYGIIRQHRGWIEVESTPGEGSTFAVFLPSAGKPETVLPESPKALESPGGCEALLLVEDEGGVRDSLARLLRKRGYQVWEAGSGPEAIARWGEREGTFDVLISDVIMPGGLTGLELADRFQRERLGLKVILMSGYNSEMAQHGVQQSPGRRFIQKPFAASDLARLIRESLDG